VEIFVLVVRDASMPTQVVRIYNHYEKFIVSQLFVTMLG